MQGLLLAGRYRLADSIGSGGMGRVWRAHDELLHRAVAIKELTAALYVSESERGVLLARTRAEARAAARINHSAVVTVHDVLEHDGRPWIVMELVEGRSLADAVKEQGRVEPAEAARIGLWVLRALRAAHAAGVLHRDVKPGNVLLGHDGRVLLTDFGIAQIEGDTTITRTGEVVGSVDYLAPERVRGHDPGPSSDLWALGATLYTAVEGRSPFRRTSPLSTMQAVVEEEATDPRYAGPLAPVISGLLRKDPAARPDAAETEQMLAEAAEGRTPGAAQAYVPTAEHPGPHRSAGRPYGTDTVASYGTGGTTAQRPGAPYGSGTHPSGTVAPYPSGGTTPYPSGPTVLGPSGAPHTPGAPGGPRVQGRRRRRMRLVALVVAVAAVVGAGTAVVLQRWDQGRDERTGGGSSSLSPSPTATHHRTDAPDGWVQVKDPLGFTLSLPKGWQRQVFSRSEDGALTQIDYTPDAGEHFLRIAVDTDPDYNDPYRHQSDLDYQLGKRLVDYKRLDLRRTIYRDRQASLWEYTWTALAKDIAFPGPRRAIDEAYLAPDGTEYALYMSSPADDWPTARQQFKQVLRSWQPKSS
ncbi:MULTISPECIES: protein kinase domain-containing protein [Streptomyces]|uniref:non-specific serine/threonine protein kinase n=2 Tax=Streptomyces TaxID=1883 RepID=A0A2U9P5F1_STRAS|nr:protein kinase [Streptomyces actuosus]AWT45000.1 serine/threonine protein kinase [Streptomyces actuosus]MBM4821560.1 protein kinase [Streptomyces actuosus]